jgi:hypothetical protein
MYNQGIRRSEVYRNLLGKPIKKSHAAVLDWVLKVVCKVGGNNPNNKSKNSTGIIVGSSFFIVCPAFFGRDGSSGQTVYSSPPFSFPAGGI